MLHYQNFMISSIKGIGSVPIKMDSNILLLIRFWFQIMPFLIYLFSPFLTSNSKKSKNNVIYFSIKLSSSVGSTAFFLVILTWMLYVLRIYTKKLRQNYLFILRQPFLFAVSFEFSRYETSELSLVCSDAYLPQSLYEFAQYLLV